VASGDLRPILLPWTRKVSRYTWVRLYLHNETGHLVIAITIQRLMGHKTFIKIIKNNAICQHCAPCPGPRQITPKSYMPSNFPSPENSVQIRP